MKKTKLLRDLIRGKKTIRFVGAHDGLSAKLGENAGFDGIWASGLEISTSFAVPDANILTMSQYLERAGEMYDSISIPVIADCDTGYGNSNNVMHMVKKYEAAGIAAVCMEDKKFPKLNSFIPGKQELASVSEFVGKIMAAKTIQEDSDFMVIARVEALIAGFGIEEALRRAEAYRDAGADAILIHSKSQTADEIFEFAKRWERRSPLVVVPTTYFRTTIDELSNAGINIVIYANQGLRAGISAVEGILSEIYQKGTTESVESKIATMKYVFELQGMEHMKKVEKDFLRDREKVVAVITAAGDHLEELSMKQISSEIPISMLDINGKTLLQRQVETLHKSFVSDVFVVGGYKKELINIDGVQMIDNVEFKSTGILHSLMCAEKYMDSKVVISYGDVYFENAILDLLLRSHEDITIVVDSSCKSKNYCSSKLFDLVIEDGVPQNLKRKLCENSIKKVKHIGIGLERDESHFEFPGLMALSVKGVEIFKDVYKASAKKYAGRQFHDAPVFEKASLADLLQEIVDLGFTVACVEVNSGWIELYSLDDYKLACTLIK